MSPAAPAVAVFGAGLIGRRHVAEIAAQARLAAIVDPDPAAQALAAAHGVPWFAHPEACLSGLSPDGVVIATPNHLHAAQAALCAAAGIPCLIEKPIAGTEEDAARIVALAARIPILIGHHRRHNPIISRAKALIDAGALGEITAVSGYFWLYKPDDYFAQAWRRQPGAGPLFINLVHDIDLLRHLVGEVSTLHALRSNARRGFAVEDTAALMMRFENGALGTFSVSDTTVAPWSWEMTSAENPVYPATGQSCYRIGGTEAALSLPDLMLWSHDGARSWWEPIHAARIDAAGGDAFALQCAHFLEVIAGAAPRVTAAEGAASQSLVLRAAAAAL